MRLINDAQEIIGEIIKETLRRFTWFTNVNVTRIVLDSRTESNLLHHFEIEGGSHS